MTLRALICNHSFDTFRDCNLDVFLRCDKLEQAEQNGKIKYRNDRFEPQAQKRIVFRGKNDFGVEEYKQVICYDRTLNSIRNQGQGPIGGWCTVAPPSDKLSEEQL